MSKLPLIPPDRTTNFQVGAPSNPCPGIDYSGADPRYQFPVGWHVQVNDNGVQGSAGSYEQNCDTLPDAAQRVAVIAKDDPLSPPRNVIRLTGGLPGHPGGAMLTYPFRDVPWGGESVSAELTVGFVKQPPDQRPGMRYFNFELRGWLNFKARKNESVECMSAQVTQDNVMLSWYRDAHDGDGVEKKVQVRYPLSLAYNIYHRFTMTLMPLPMPDTWQAHFRVRSDGHLLWSYASNETNHPNNIRIPNMFTFGDERTRDEWGGVSHIARAAVFAETL